MEGLNCSANDNLNSQKYSQVAVVTVPFPAQGHLNQLLHLSYLIASNGMPVHYVGFATHNRQAKLRLHGRDSERSANIYFHDFQLPLLSSPPPNPNPLINFPAHLQPLFDASTHLRQPLSQLLQQLSANFRRIVVIHDSLMTSVVQDVKSIANAESYTFMPLSAFAQFLAFWDSIPEKPFQLDADFPKCIPSAEGCLTPEFVSFIANQRKFLGLQSGRLYNTSRLLERKYLKLLEKLTAGTDIKHFAIGPINPVEVKGSSNLKYRHECLQWLDKQEAASVIYVSFGSTTTMTDEQIIELAKGLERSEQKFIWVLRRADKGDIFEEGEEKMPQLPQGFEERLKDRGMVEKEWAPQVEILSHQATGGFMSHCGWNSSIESMSMGVPIAAWPMHSDQPRNTILITQVLKVGIVVLDWAQRSELVTSTTIQNAVRTLMASKQGAEIRKRAAELGDLIRGSVAKGGSSRLELDSFIAHITR